MRRWRNILISLSVLAIVWVASAPILATFLILQKPLEQPDAIIVLSGSSQYVERCRKAAEVIRERKISIVYLTNDGERSGWSVAENRNIPYLELERRELIANGVFNDSIRVLADVVKGTDDEAKAMAEEAKRQGFKSVLIVTSSYHSRRAYNTFERMFANSGIAVGVENASLSDNDPSPMWWWLSRRGWQLVGGEYVKSAVYWVYS